MNNNLENKNKDVEMEGTQVVLPFEITEEFFVENLGEIKKKPFYDFFKRLFDIVVAIIGLVILLIPMIVIAIAIKSASKGPVFYYQDRLGRNGKVIHIIKFRTMHKDAEANGAQWSLGDDDPRIFPLGRVLRNCRADELPQLWCILKGERGIIETTKKNADFSRVVTVNSISL